MSGFTRTLLYGAFAAAVLPLVVLAVAPVTGSATALGLYAVSAVAGYLAALADGLRRRVGVALAAAALGLLAWAASGSLSQLFVLLTLGVALARSSLLFRRRDPLRSLVIEGLVLVLALVTVRFLAAPGPVGSAVALWGWFVVQSFAFLLGGMTRRRSAHPGDAFENARRHLEELLSS